MQDAVGNGAPPSGLPLQSGGPEVAAYPRLHLLSPFYIQMLFISGYFSTLRLRYYLCFKDL